MFTFNLNNSYDVIHRHSFARFLDYSSPLTRGFTSIMSPSVIACVGANEEG